MTFTLLPAVDVADGLAVRLVQGREGTETTHGAPLDAALAWQSGGAEWIHLVDLDAALGRGSNHDLLAAVIEELDVNVELSGGINNDASLNQALATGCIRIILATTALKDPNWCARVIAAVHLARGDAGYEAIRLDRDKASIIRTKGCCVIGQLGACL